MATLPYVWDVEPFAVDATPTWRPPENCGPPESPFQATPLMPLLQMALPPNASRQLVEVTRTVAVSSRLAAGPLKLVLSGRSWCWSRRRKGTRWTAGRTWC